VLSLPWALHFRVDMAPPHPASSSTRLLTYPLCPSYLAQTMTWRSRSFTIASTMVKADGKSRTVQVELPDELFEAYPWDPHRIALQLRMLWLLEQVRERRLGHGKAAELAGVARAQFLEIMGEHQMSAFDYDAHELDEEFG